MNVRVHTAAAKCLLATSIALFAFSLFTALQAASAQQPTPAQTKQDAATIKRCKQIGIMASKQAKKINEVYTTPEGAVIAKYGPNIGVGTGVAINASRHTLPKIKATARKARAASIAKSKKIFLGTKSACKKTATTIKNTLASYSH